MTPRNRLLFVLLAALTIASNANAIPSRPINRNMDQGFPAPPTTTGGGVGQCLQQIEPRVCDPHGVLSVSELQRLNALLTSLEANTKSNYYPLPAKTKKCGMKGITARVVLLRADLVGMNSVQAQLNELNQEYTDAHPCERIVFLMLNVADRVEQRRLWTSVNWNVNVQPAQILALYQKIPLVQKSQYGQALFNIVEEIMSISMRRLNVQKPLSSLIGSGRTQLVVQ